jgi:hypothetical protein
MDRRYLAKLGRVGNGDVFWPEARPRVTQVREGGRYFSDLVLAGAVVIREGLADFIR